MDVTDALKDFMRLHGGTGIVPAEVTAVTDVSVDCRDFAGNEYLDVRLNANSSELGWRLRPSLGSTVLIQDLTNGGTDFVMVAASELDYAMLEVAQDTRITVDQDEIALGLGKNQPAVLGDDLNENLEELIERLDGLLDALRTFATAQIAATTGPLAPLNPAYGALNVQLTAVQTALAALPPLLANHKSNIVTISP